MSSLLHAARLTRPQRLRCRSRPFALTPITATHRHASGPSSAWSPPPAAARYRKRPSAADDPDEPIGSEGTVHLRKGDKLDWEVAVQMAEERKRRDETDIRNGQSAGPIRQRDRSIRSRDGWSS